MRTKLVSGMLAALLFAALPFASNAQVAIGVSVDLAPPPLPVYTQPPCPGPGYIWVPGYWAYGDDDYYWVPGTWALAPEVGFLWTPGWWGWGDGGYVFHSGYWGPQVGFYGGIDYGFGYSGRGYDGGYWRDRQFYYNRSVNNISNTTNITNVYNKTVVNVSVNHVSYNGEQGGVRVQRTAAERAAEQAPHVGPTAVQVQHRDLAAKDRELRASVNQGKPAVAATVKPGEFSGRDVVGARAAGGPVHTAQPRSAETRAGATQAPDQAQQREQQARTQEQQRSDRQRSAQAPQQRADQQHEQQA